MANVNIRVQSVGEEEQTGVPSVAKKDEKSGGAKTTATSLFVHQAINTGKQILNFGISNIGNFTGDYVKQDRVQNIVGNVGDLVGIGIAFSVNPAAGIAAVMGFATKNAFEIVNIQTNARRQEITTQYLRERSGNSTTNGSRTGD